MRADSADAGRVGRVRLEVRCVDQLVFDCVYEKASAPVEEAIAGPVINQTFEPTLKSLRHDALGPDAVPLAKHATYVLSATGRPAGEISPRIQTTPTTAHGLVGRVAV